TAVLMAEAGAQVILAARSEEGLKKTLERLPRSDTHQIISLDLMQTLEIAGKVKAAEEKCNQPITVLVCNSGGPKAGPLSEAGVDDLEQGFRAHVLANQTLVQAVVPAMRDKGYGRIINVISTSVKIPIPNLGVSNTIRGAVANWAKTLSMELGGFGITVNNVLPGYTKTQRLDALVGAASQRLGKSEDEIVELWKSKVPARRFADPKETAAAIAFLASPHASYINGVNLPVDGGRTGSL
ncbi:MAG: SDR family oxidoreductase, partial [Pseudomonadota bacterium]